MNPRPKKKKNSVARQEFSSTFVPDGEEGKPTDSYGSSDEDSESDDDSKGKLDVMKARQYGSRKSARKRAAPPRLGFFLNTQQITMSEDSEA